jgi:hypothetical protein
MLWSGCSREIRVVGTVMTLQAGPRHSFAEVCPSIILCNGLLIAFCLQRKQGAAPAYRERCFLLLLRIVAVAGAAPVSGEVGRCGAGSEG